MEAEEEKTQLKLSGGKERKPVSKFSKFSKVAFTITHTPLAGAGHARRAALEVFTAGIWKRQLREQKRPKGRKRRGLGPLCSF